VEGIVTTDAELDHTLGLVLLREARALQLYATASVRNILECSSNILPVTGAFAAVTVTETGLHRRSELKYRDRTLSGIAVTPFPVPGDPPRFAPDAEPGHTVGLIVEDEATGGRMAFVPGCGELDSELQDTDLLLFDGTFWSDDELVALGISERRAREMDHLPISGNGGSLSWLSSLQRPQTVYTHINNTNPILLEDSSERAEVEQRGLKVGFDGMSFSI
jgi:pyrroloquinoline quinone biosynthesis protein B